MSNRLNTNAAATVLVVEDDPIFRLLISTIAESCECGVHAVPTVQRALECLSHNDYRVVFLDCYLPDGHGADVAEFLRSRTGGPDCLVIALSTDDSPENVARVMQAGAARFLRKPVSVAEIKLLLRKHCSDGGIEGGVPQAIEPSLNLMAGPE